MSLRSLFSGNFARGNPKSPLLMDSVKKKLENGSQKIVHRLFLLLGVLVRRMSRRSFEGFAELLGDVAYDVFRIRRSLVEANLSGTFPEKGKKEISGIARKVYRRQAINLFEVLRLPLIRDRTDAAGLLDIDGREFLRKTAEAGKGAVVVSAHFGNWELLGFCVGLLVTPMHIVVKKLKNSLVDRDVNAWRTRKGNRVLYKRTALRKGLDVLAKGGVMTVLGDQSDPRGGFRTAFLGRSSSVFLGPSFLALKADVPMFLGMCRRLESGRYIVEVQEIETADLSFCKEDIRELTRRYTRAIERYIYRYPEEWFWLHNRWKRGGKE